MLDEREVTLPWESLADILRRSNEMRQEEEIHGITLMKPKQLRLYFRQKTNNKKGGPDVSRKDVSKVRRGPLLRP